MQINYSFIIPHKNCPELLTRCVDSIPERDDVQVIVVDDNSDEGRKPALRERKNLQVILLDASQSKGAGRARNVGLKHAEGKWLLFPDSDDCYNDGFLDILDKYVNHDIEVLYFNAAHRDGYTGELLKDVSFKKYIDAYDNTKITADKVKFRNNVPWSKMVKRELVTKYNIKFEEVPNGNDILFSMMVAYLATKIDVDTFVVYNYYKNSGSIVSKRKSTEEMLCVLQHRMQQNYLYRFLGYSNWTISIYKFIYIYTRQYGFSFIAAYIKNFSLLYGKRKDWVNLLLSSESISNKLF